MLRALSVMSVRVMSWLASRRRGRPCRHGYLGGVLSSLCSGLVARRTCAANPRATMDTLVPLVLDEDNVVRREAIANLIRRRM